MNIFYYGRSRQGIYSRLVAAGHAAKIFYYDEASSTLEVVNLLQNRAATIRHLPAVPRRLQTRRRLPNTASSSPTTPTTKTEAAKPSPPISTPTTTSHRRALHRHRLQCHPPEPRPVAEHGHAAGLRRARRHLRSRPAARLPARHTLSRSPPTPARSTPSHFDRLGVRVPAILVSPWIAAGSVINDTFDHACIPATVTDFLQLPDVPRSPRELNANTFLGNLTLTTMRADNECPSFVIQPANS